MREFYFHSFFSCAGASMGNDDDGGGMDTTSIVMIVIWQFILTAGLFTVCGCYISRRYKSKNTVTDDDINFTDLEKINTGRSTPNLTGETMTRKTAKLETSVNFVTSTTTTRGNKETEEPTVTVVKKSVQFEQLQPQKSLPPIPSKRSLRKSIEPGPYSITEDVDASGPALSAKQSFIGMVLESMDDFEV